MEKQMLWQGGWETSLWGGGGWKIEQYGAGGSKVAECTGTIASIGQ